MSEALGKIYHDRQTCAGRNTRLRLNTIESPGARVNFTKVGDCWPCCPIKPFEVLRIGDTLHDAELAEAINVNCVLVAHGHPSRQRLKPNGGPLVDSLREFF